MVGKEDGDIKMFTVSFFYILHWMAGGTIQSLGSQKEYWILWRKIMNLVLSVLGFSSPQILGLALNGLLGSNSYGQKDGWSMLTDHPMD